MRREQEGLRYAPVVAVGSGLVVGAEVLPPGLSCEAAQAFAFGVPAEEGWWVTAHLPPEQITSPAAADQVADLLARSGLPASRLALVVTQAELIHAERTGVAAAFGELGVAFVVPLDLTGLGDPELDDVGLIRAVVRRARSSGAEVLGRNVESAAQLALASEGGVAFVTGYWWGSPGSLTKLVTGWARLGITE